MKKSTIILSLMNILGMLCLIGYAWSARDLAIIEERSSYDFGDSVGFLLMVAPVLLLGLVANIIWAGTALLAMFRQRSIQSATACLIVVALWAVVVLATRELTSLPSTQSLQPTHASQAGAVG